MGLGTLVDGQPAVIAIEARLDAVGRREHRREHLEAVWRIAIGAAREDVIRVLQPGPWTARLGIPALVRIAAQEAALRRGVLVRDALGAVIADPDAAAAARQGLLDGREVVIEPAVGVHRARFLPGMPAILRNRELDVVLPVPIVLPDGVEVVVLRVPADPREVVGADVRPGDAFLGTAPEVALRLAGDDVVAHFGRLGAVEVRGPVRRVARRTADHAELLPVRVPRRVFPLLKITTRSPFG